MDANEIKRIISQLENGELTIRDVPEDVERQKDILATERKLGIRKELERGADAIQNNFFIHEKICWNNSEGELEEYYKTIKFETFEEYYDFLAGDIYDMACYRYFDFSKYKDFISIKGIDLQKLLSRESFLSETIDNAKLEITQKDRDEYKEGEKNKRTIKIWTKKFEDCKSGIDLAEVIKKYKKSKLSIVIDVSFFLYQYIFHDISDKQRFGNIMEYMSYGNDVPNLMNETLCAIYNPSEVIALYNYSGGAQTTYYRHKMRLKESAKLLESGSITFKIESYFDSKSHYYCEKVEGFQREQFWKSISYQKSFETFEEFVEYRKGNLRGTDLSKALHLDIDFSKYETDETTILPIINAGETKCTIKKEYQNGVFIVKKEWRNSENCLLKELDYETPYFFDFVYYLKGDLSKANLLFCDGLKNIVNFEDVDFSGAILVTQMCEKFGVPYEFYPLKKESLKNFDITEHNEETSVLAWSSRDVVDRDECGLISVGNYDIHTQKIYYVTDLHLMHRLQHAKCKSKADIRYVLQKIVDNIVRETGGILLIGGDVSSDFTIFKCFLKLLKISLTKKQFKEETKVIFILGNHELWGLPEKTFGEIVDDYRTIIEDHEMYLIHNELLYFDSENQVGIITNDELVTISRLEIRNRIRCAKLVIFGGIGFSGYNKEFNADSGVYRGTLNRTQEIEETQKFESLYNKISPCISDKNTIIFTHMPKKDWSNSLELEKQVVYISGHNHRNEFYDDGDYRIYADNQIGYKNENIHLKSILMDKDYDYFADYEDGIYEINQEQYIDFYRGKNIFIEFTRKINVLYMLKKNNYYCFIHKNKTGGLCILNGGALRKLEQKDIHYYYNNMEQVITMIKKPLDKYTDVQMKIAETIQQIGGSGKIHGCIIDIDWFNHIYVNPVDMTMVGYWALNMIEKIVYPNIPELLKVNCPKLYDNYRSLVADKNNVANPVVSLEYNEVVNVQSPQEYLSTDIYKASREIKKMQRLSSNILSIWIKDPNSINNLIED